VPKLSRPFQTAQRDVTPQPPHDEWRRYRRAFRWRIVLIVALLAVGVVTFIVLNEGGSGGLRAFNACIRQQRSLLLLHSGSTGVVETIRDRASGALEGEVTTGSTMVSGYLEPITLGGAAASSTGGRYTMSTVTPTGRDPYAIENCWNVAYPEDPNA
jgi:hypothetical protein